MIETGTMVVGKLIVLPVAVLLSQYVTSPFAWIVALKPTEFEPLATTRFVSFARSVNE